MGQEADSSRHVTVFGFRGMISDSLCAKMEAALFRKPNFFCILSKDYNNDAARHQKCDIVEYDGLYQGVVLCHEHIRVGSNQQKCDSLVRDEPVV